MNPGATSLHPSSMLHGGYRPLSCPYHVTKVLHEKFSNNLLRATCAIRLHSSYAPKQTVVESASACMTRARAGPVHWGLVLSDPWPARLWPQCPRAASGRGSRFAPWQLWSDVRRPSSSSTLYTPAHRTPTGMSVGQGIRQQERVAAAAPAPPHVQHLGHPPRSPRLHLMWAPTSHLPVRWASRYRERASAGTCRLYRCVQMSSAERTARLDAGAPWAGC